MFGTCGTEYHVSRVLPSGFRPDSGSRRIPEQIILALELFNSDVCSAESEVIHGNRRIPKNEAGPEPEKNGMHNLGQSGGWWVHMDTIIMVRG